MTYHNEFRESDPFSPLINVYRNITNLCSLQSEFQKIDVLFHPFFGRMLLLDDVVQLTEWDEFFYHELLVHVPLASHPCPADVLIIGGGDGGSLREVLKHQRVVSVTLVELDSMVVDVSKKFLPTLSTGFADPRVHIIHMDGAEFLKDVPSEFDVIIIDGPDPVGGAQNLLSNETLENAHLSLKEEGILTAQTESLHFHRDFLLETQSSLANHFPIVDLYTMSSATYSGNWWTFSIGSKKYSPRNLRRSAKIQCRYYSLDVHRRSFLPSSVYMKLLNKTLAW